MNHLWERQSKALGLALVREKIIILVASHFQQQPPYLPEGVCFTWTLLCMFLGCYFRAEKPNRQTEAFNTSFSSLGVKRSCFCSLRLSAKPHGALHGACSRVSRVKSDFGSAGGQRKVALATGRKNRNEIKKQVPANVPSSCLFYLKLLNECG